MINKQEKIDQMIKCKVHIGHQARNSNSIIKKFLIGRKNNVDIFNLKYSLSSLEIAKKVFYWAKSLIAS